MKIRKILLLLLLPVLLSGQNTRYRFKHFTIEDGLIQSSVASIIEDSKGFIWFGTLDGLSKFDGYKYINFKSHANDSNSLVNNLIQTLYEDSDGKIWIGTRTGISIYHRDKNNFTTFQPLSNLQSLNVTAITQDANGIIYIGTYGNGLFSYNTRTGKIRTFRYSKNNNSLCSDYVLSLKIVNDKVWIGTYHGLSSLDPANSEFTTYKRASSKEWEKNVITSISADETGAIWIGSYNGVARLIKEKSRFEDYLILPGNPNLTVRDILFVEKNIIWAGSDKGIVKLDILTKKVSFIKHEPYNFESPASNEIACFYKDRSGGIWIGTRADGADRLKHYRERFSHYKMELTSASNLSNNEVYGFAEDKNNNIWIATLNGLNKFNPASETFTHYFKKNYPGITIDRLWNIYTNKKYKNDFVWVGSDAGLFVMSISSGNIVNPFRNRSLLDSMKSDRILDIIIDPRYNLWLATENGLIRINLETEKIKRYLHTPKDPGSISNSYAWRLYVDSKNNLWIGTTKGLNMYDPLSDKFINYTNRRNDPNSIGNDEVNVIFEDRQGQYWIGTSDGLYKFILSSGKFEKINLKHALSETIYSMQEDKNNCLWVSTARGLIKFDKNNGDVTTFDAEDGIQGNEFNFASIISSDGKYYFSGVNGFSVFKPEDIYFNKHVPPVYLTGFYISNQPVEAGNKINGRVLFPAAFENIKEVTLTYEENKVGFEFAALDYQAASKNKYMYYMENFDSGWIEAGNRRFAAYTLEPGDYILHVKGSNNDNVWNNEGVKIQITVLPPWWLTVWFRVFALLMFAGIAYAGYSFRIRYLRNQTTRLENLVIERTGQLTKQQEIVREQAEKIQNANIELEQLNSELEQRVAERTFELEQAKEKAEKADKLKSEFLAQMSHEIRSPINVVLSFSSLIRSEVENKVDEDIREGFKSISNAGKRIIRTIDLLLNMAEVQTNTYDFYPQTLNLLDDIIYPLLPEYQLSAKERKLALSVDDISTQKNITGDHYTLEQIFANLIDNALKYTSEGSIKIKTYNDTNGALFCEVRDTGIGIGKEFMDKIFHPFTQEEQGYTRKYEGNGLGLALVKKYCELNNIDISVESEKGKGTAFILKFTPPNKPV